MNFAPLKAMMSGLKFVTFLTVFVFSSSFWSLSAQEKEDLQDFFGKKPGAAIFSILGKKKEPKKTQPHFEWDVEEGLSTFDEDGEPEARQDWDMTAFANTPKPKKKKNAFVAWFEGLFNKEDKKNSHEQGVDSLGFFEEEEGLSTFDDYDTPTRLR